MVVRTRVKASTPMDRRDACGLSASLVLAIVSIFLFFSPQDPYSVVHGPAAAFQAARAATRVRTSIVQAVLHPVPNVPGLPFVVVAKLIASKAESFALVVAHDITIFCSKISRSTILRY